MSPDCQDIEFATGKISTRGGLATPFSAEGTNKINGLKSYVKLDLTKRLLVFLSDGTLKVENTPGSLATISSSLLSGAYMAGTTLFDREYLAFSQAAVGEDFPRYYDDTNLRRVSQAGPGSGPQLADVTTDDQNYTTGQDEDHELNGASVGNLAQSFGFSSNVTVATVQLRLKKIGAPTGNLTLDIQTDADGVPSGTSLGTSNNVDVSTLTAGYTWITFTFATPVALGKLQDPALGNPYWMVLDGDATYDGVYVTATTTAVWGADGSDPGYVSGMYASHDGTSWFTDSSKDFLFQVATVSGSVPEGRHKCICWFETDSGYWTKASPPISRRLSGNKSITVSNIPIGPSNVVARRLAFTIAEGEEFYHISNTMTIEDNTTTSLVVDFTDTDLLAGTLVDKQLRAIQLPPQANVLSYSNRLVWMGERNRIHNFVNLSFDGGFTTFGSDDVPNGWQVRLSGGSRETSDVVSHEAYKITGDGSAAVGWISQSAFADRWDALPIIEPGKAYRVKARVKKSASLVAGTFNIDIYSPSGVIDTVGLQVTAATATTSYVEYEAELTAALATVPGDLQLRVFADITPTSGESFFVDEIEIWPTAHATNPSLARVSDVENPEFYDGLGGFLNVAENNGEALITGFVIRDILYLVKERSFFATKDDGRNPSALWPIDEVSPSVGTPSIWGVGIGEDWVIICGRQGAYFFNGGRPEKLTQEIDAEWKTINWTHGSKLWCVVNHEDKQIYIGAPTGAATEPDKLWMMDYKEGFGDPLRNGGRGRQWCPWITPANSAAMIERAGVTKPFFVMGGNDAAGLVYEYDRTATSDNGVAIDSYYRTAFLSSTEFTGRQLFGYLTLYAHGTGTLDILAYKPDETTKAITGFTLAAAQKQDFERMINILSERVSYRIRTDGLNENFTLTKFVPWAKPSPFDFVRGTN
jgi:hypothetical protein